MYSYTSLKISLACLFNTCLRLWVCFIFCFERIVYTRQKVKNIYKKILQTVVAWTRKRDLQRIPPSEIRPAIVVNKRNMYKRSHSSTYQYTRQKLIHVYCCYSTYLFKQSTSFLLLSINIMILIVQKLKIVDSS